MKKLLFSVAAAVLVAFGVNAADMTWNFSDAIWAGGHGQTTPTNDLVYGWNGLTLNWGDINNVNFMAITANNASFSDGTSFTMRAQTNGGGVAAAAVGVSDGTPTQRFLSIQVSGPSTVKIWGKSGSSGVDRAIVVSDGTNVIGSGLSDGSSTLDVGNIIVTANYTGAAGTLYIYGLEGAVNLYQITATNVNTAINDVKVDNPNCKVTGYFNLLGQNLGNDAPEKGVYIVTYDNCAAEKFVK